MVDNSANIKDIYKTDFIELSGLIGVTIDGSEYCIIKA